jgi:hypothetical protein
VSDASDKLARTRLAIIEHVHRKKHPDYAEHRAQARREEAEEEREERELRTYVRGDAPPRASASAKGWLASGKRALGAWWRHHPAHMGVELATPMLSDFAGRRPVIYLGLAAVLGAAIVVGRPWRLISATGLIVAIVKSSQLSSMVMSAMSAADFGRDPPPWQ